MPVLPSGKKLPYTPRGKALYAALTNKRIGKTLPTDREPTMRKPHVSTKGKGSNNKGLRSRAGTKR